jgi:lipid A disaccharide synthetase
MDKMKYRFVKPEVRKLLQDENYRSRMMEYYQELHQRVGERGASERAAFQMIQILRSYRQKV